MIFKDQPQPGNDGYIVLLSTLIVGLLVTSLTVGVLLQSSSATNNSISRQRHEEAYNLAELCVEDALQNINDDTTYTGSSTLSFSMGMCEYTVIDNGGEVRTITSEGVTNNIIYSRIKVTTSALTPNITIASWQELSEFTP